MRSRAVAACLAAALLACAPRRGGRDPGPGGPPIDGDGIDGHVDALAAVDAAASVDAAVVSVDAAVMSDRDRAAARRAVLDELERLARELAVDRPLDELYQRLGPRRTDVDGGMVEIDPVAVGVDVIRAPPRGWGEVTYVEVRLLEPVTVAMLVERFGELDHWLTDEWPGPYTYMSEGADHGGAFAVRVAVALWKTPTEEAAELKSVVGLFRHRITPPRPAGGTRPETRRARKP